MNHTDVLEALEEHNLFLTGGAGVGKSYITNEVITHYRKEGKQVIALGSTGVSAVNIGGFTVHSFFAFGIASNFDALSQHDKYNKKRLSELKKILKATDLIIVDEISMVSSDLLDMITFRLRNYGYNGRVMFVGDFYQLPPVQKAQYGDVFGERLYAFESSAWEYFNFQVIELTEMKRTEDKTFTHILSKVRVGVCDGEVETYIQGLSTNTIEESTNPTYLFGRNVEVERTNREKLNQLESEEVILFANVELSTKVHEKRLASWKAMLPVNEQLTLKEGAPILFTINKWGKFVNGERGILHSIEDDALVVEKENEFVRVERHEFDLSDMEVDSEGKVTAVAVATLSQFPVKLAYAVTIHKSQGMSISHLVCNVDHIFAPSQFYVAISRAVDPHYLRIDFSKGDIGHYLHKVIRIDPRVTEYYKALGQ
jgi:ATP-dependent exoDNAse (exonuclease V) alpha subunit